MLAASWWTIASQHLLTFIGGVTVGFSLTSRYRITKRNGKEDA
jgi:hypothetical protein